VKILVVDDSSVFRLVIKSIVRPLPFVADLLTAANGEAALKIMQSQQVDIVLTDLEMPVMNGVDLLRNIQSKFPAVQVVIISSLSKTTSELGAEALSLGALEFVQKMSVNESFGEIQKDLRDRIVSVLTSYHESQKGRGSSPGSKPASLPQKTGIASSGSSLPEKKPSSAAPKRTLQKAPRLLLIGISTGGPNALTQMIPQLRTDLTFPIVIVQHIPEGFSEHLCQRLTRISKLEVREINDSVILEAGKVYMAKGGTHAVLKAEGDQLIVEEKDFARVHGCKPSVDVLFQSVAQTGVKNLATLIMTGMGKDGLKGVQMLRSKGAYSMVQDQESSVVWGMPRAVFEADEYDKVVSLEEISSEVNRMQDL